MWCLGQFDRPFKPPQPIFGTVRCRSTEAHAERLDTAAYLEKTTRPLLKPPPKVAIIGAGMSGLACGRTLADHGLQVTVFEKGRGVGGRMATRRTEEGLRFDHGAQYFTARDERFSRYVSSWFHDGLVQLWRGRIVVLDEGQIREENKSTERYVAVPGMNAICKHLATGLDVQCQTRVAPLVREQELWHLHSEDGTELGKFDFAVTTAPPAQAAALLNVASRLAAQAEGTPMNGCWAVMVAFETPLPLEFSAAFVHNSPLSWIARNSSKPDRDMGVETWVLHASPEWTAMHMEDDPEAVSVLLLDELWRAARIQARRAEFCRAHRWRFALPPEPLEERCIVDSELQVVACGDWCGGPRVEGAFLSGMAAAGRVLGLLKTDSCASIG